MSVCFCVLAVVVHQILRRRAETRPLAQVKMKCHPVASRLLFAVRYERRALLLSDNHLSMKNLLRVGSAPAFPSTAESSSAAPEGCGTAAAEGSPRFVDLSAPLPPPALVLLFSTVGMTVARLGLPATGVPVSSVLLV
ncbi:hypothetical protein EYF80_046348 [Liparis tanakae]|uniref:Uncharacterized protein n=1 Tax=Liparis tanakae TaxID=230148 RepID=A0A4Z2FRH7_9TELE|nr:hypothetical protein EYF80_046348 [Liparis tanakae]